MLFGEYISTCMNIVPCAIPTTVVVFAVSSTFTDFDGTTMTTTKQLNTDCGIAFPHTGQKSRTTEIIIKKTRTHMDMEIMLRAVEYAKLMFNSG